MSGIDDARLTPAGLHAVLVTEEWGRRAARSPDFQAESDALAALADVMASRPDALLQKLVDLVLDLCGADAAGIGFSETGNIFRWRAVAGSIALNADVPLPMETGACWQVIQRNQTLLFTCPQRHDEQPRPAEPRIEEALLAPFHEKGEPAGIVWAMTHTARKRFDAEDARLLTRLSNFTATAYQLTSALRTERQRRAQIESEVQARTAAALTANSFAESVVETVRDPLLVLDGQLRVVSASREFYAAFGVSRHETEGRRLYDMGNGQWAIPELRTLLEDILSQQNVLRDFEVDHTFPHIGRKVMLLNARRLQQGHGHQEMFLLAIEDITERREAEAARHEAEARFTEMVKNVRDHAFFMTDPNGVITTWNVAAERVFGYLEQEAVGQHFSVLFTPEDVVEAWPERELAQARTEGRAEDERWHLRKNGERFWAQGIVTPRVDDRNGLVGYSKILRDMTERQLAENALRASQEQFRRALTIGTVGVLFFRLDGTIVDANASFERMVGYRVADLRALPDWIALTAPEFHDVTTAAAAQLAERGEAPAYEKQLIRQDGSRFWGLFAPTRLTGSGSQAQCVEFILDITDRKAAEEALQQSKQRQAFLLRLSDALRLLADPADIESEATALLGQELGVSHAYYVEIDETKGMARVASGHLPDNAPPLAGQHRLSDLGWLTRLLRQGTTLAMKDMAYAGGLPAADLVNMRALDMGAHLHVALVDDSGQTGALCVAEAAPRAWSEAEIGLVRETAERIRAAVERARAEAALRDSEERLKLALAAARMGSWQWEVSPDRHRRDANLNRLLGLDAVETVQPISEFFTHIAPEDRVRVQAAFDASIKHGHDLQVDFRVIWPDGGVHWLSDKGDVFGTRDGRYLAGACVDITDRKHLEAQLREADRRKDEFLAMLGHELRNPLAPLRNALDAVRRHKVDGAVLERAHAMMERQVGHLSRLVNDLLDVSRITLDLIELHKETVNLADVAEQAIEMAMPAVEGRGQELSLALPHEPVLVQGDIARLTQVVFNLLNNATKYTPSGGRIGLSIEHEGGEVAVHVSDNGSGMTGELVPRVFELFTQGTRTLDRSQGGLGLGLTLVKRLVEMHGGSVAASSPGPGQGSEFVVRLPVLSAIAAPPASIAQPAPSSAPVAGLALVVDDVPDIADSYVWLLDGLISEVQVAYSGPQALALASERPPDLVVCDLGMPGMDGYETCRRLRQLPGMAATIIAAVSGYGGDEYVNASMAAGFDRHLVKPISHEILREMAQAVAKRPT